MGSKIIGLIGVLVSGAFVYYCIDIKKDEIADACQASQAKQKITETKINEKNSSIEATASSSPVTKNELPSVQTVEKSPDKVPVVQESAQRAEKSDPAFGVMFGDQINVVGMFAPAAKKKPLIHYIDQLCKNNPCNNDIRFSGDMKEVAWQKDIVLLMKMFETEHIKKGSIYINSNVLHIEGEIENKSQKKELEDLIAKLKKDGVFVEDETISMLTKVKVAIPEAPEENLNRESEIKKIKEQIPETETKMKIESKTETESKENRESVQPVEESTVKSSATAVKTDVEVSKSDSEMITAKKNPPVESNTLDEILKMSPLSFDARVKNLSEESKKTLDKIADILKQKKPEKIEILGYSGTGENGVFDMVVSQKKADIVKNYLYAKGLRNLTSKGLGAKKKSVEIEIKIKNSK